MNPLESYKKHKDQLERLRNISPEKRPKTLSEAVVVQEAIAEHETEMKKASKRLTYDQKKELGILGSQRGIG